MDFGLPQGSVLGSMGFTLYTNPRGDIIRRHNVSYHKYADDTRLCVELDPKYVKRRTNLLINFQNV